MIDKNKRVLMLVESPEKAKKITGIFRDAGYNKVIVMATFGHFTKIKDGTGYYNTGIHPEDNFKIDYVIDPEKRKQVEDLREQVKFADYILIAADLDREGEKISESCIKFLKIPKNKYQRVRYNAINQKAIFEAIDKNEKLDENLVKAASTRGALDKMVGYRVSDILRKKGKGKSAGRVQSAALKMIVDREEEILNFKPEKYIDLYLLFSKRDVEFKAKYQGTDKNPVDNLRTDAEVEKIVEDCRGNAFIVKSVEHKDRLENPKPPFSTATFQQECASKLGLTVKQAQDAAQHLYEAGFISYHRTDDEEFAPEFEEELKAFVLDTYGKDYASKTVTKGKKSDDQQNAHEGLHCLDLSLTPDLFAKQASTPLLAKVYRIIYNRTVAAALKPAIIAQTIYNIYNGDHKFVLKSNELKFDGYRTVYNYKDDSDEEELVKETFKEQEKLNNCSLEAVPKETKPKPRYKEASFVKAMKEVGIGRPSTYVPTIETIKSADRGYCVVEDGYLRPTEKGIEVSHFLQDNFDKLFTVGYTAEMEKSLDLIANDKLDWLEFIKEFYDNLEETSNKIVPTKTSPQATGKLCPECGKPLVVRIGKYGPFTACSGFPKCRYIDKSGK